MSRLTCSGARATFALRSDYSSSRTAAQSKPARTSKLVSLQNSSSWQQTCLSLCLANLRAVSTVDLQRGLDCLQLRSEAGKLCLLQFALSPWQDLKKTARILEGLEEQSNELLSSLEITKKRCIAGMLAASMFNENDACPIIRRFRFFWWRCFWPRSNPPSTQKISRIGGQSLRQPAPSGILISRLRKGD